MRAIAIASMVMLGGCSALVSFTTLHAKSDAPGWEQAPLKAAQARHPGFLKYTHSHERLTIMLCTVVGKFSPVAIGPPVIPLVPGSWLIDEADLVDEPADKLFIFAQIDSPADKATVDFAQARLVANEGGQPLAPSAVARYQKNSGDEVCGRQPRDAADPGAYQEIQGTAQFLLTFDIPIASVDSFELRLPAIRYNGEDVVAVPLYYRRERFWFYVPLVLPPEGKVIGPVIF